MRRLPNPKLAKTFDTDSDLKDPCQPIIHFEICYQRKPREAKLIIYLALIKNVNA